LFQAWVEARGGTGEAAEIKLIIAQVRRFLEQHDTEAFVRAGACYGTESLACEAAFALCADAAGMDERAVREVG
jgi:hypothetical protein